MGMEGLEELRRELEKLGARLNERKKELSVDGYLPPDRLVEIRAAESRHNEAWTDVQFALATEDSAGGIDRIASRIHAARERINRL